MWKYVGSKFVTYVISGVVISAMTMSLLGMVKGITGTEQDFGEVIVTAKEDKAFLSTNKKESKSLVSLVIAEEGKDDENTQDIQVMSNKARPSDRNKSSSMGKPGSNSRPSEVSKPGMEGYPEGVRPEGGEIPSEDELVPEVEQEILPEEGTVPELDENGEFQLDLEFTMDPELEFGGVEGELEFDEDDESVLDEESEPEAECEDKPNTEDESEDKLVEEDESEDELDIEEKPEEKPEEKSEEKSEEELIKADEFSEEADLKKEDELDIVELGAMNDK